MCWGEAASWTMAAAGVGMTVVSARRGDPPAIPAAFGYFSAMELLQGLGYRVIDACGTPANELVTYLSLLHIAFQPLFINAFAMELAPRPIARGLRAGAFVAAACASLVILLQLHPFGWAGRCTPGVALCGPVLCTSSGSWHIAWTAPYNGLMSGVESAVGIAPGFPTYFLAVFALPLVYGAWRFTLFHALAGPVLASRLTDDPNEMPAIWCLFSIGLVAMGLSPWLRGRLAAPGGWGRAAPQAEGRRDEITPVAKPPIRSSPKSR